jgi:dihydroorotase
MLHHPVDLLIRAGRVFCAATGFDGPGAVAVSGDRIIAVASELQLEARQTLAFPDGLLLPGLVDFHAHPDRGASRFGVDPDLHLLPFGTTTALSQGDAGAANWSEYRSGTLGTSRTRLRMALNLAAHGEATAGGGCLENLDAADVEACVTAVEQGGDAIWGIAVNTSIPTCGATDPREVLRRGLEAADRTGKPLLFGSRRAPDWPLVEQLPFLRPGDVVTYCFSPDPNGLLAGDRVRDEVWEARARGVRFDLGHGMGSFSFRVAEAAVRQGFYPDTISTDLYRRHLDQTPRHDLPRTMSKLLACGMPEREVFARATHVPALLLGLAGEVGTLALGTCADLAVLQWSASGAPLRDTLGETRPGGCWEPVLTVRGGVPVRQPE